MLVWGSGASGREVEVVASAIWSLGAVLWAGQSRLVARRRMAARQREVLTLGCVTGIGKFGRQLTVPLFGGYHRRTARWAMGLR
jgi:hypothetical protein